jgi:hypothetical protein
VAKATRREATSSREREINKRAIRELRAVSDKFSRTVSGFTLANEARALERVLAAPNSRKATTQKRVQAFAQAAAKYSPPDRVMKRVVKTGAARKAKTATPGIIKRAKKNQQVRYKTHVFKCLGDYEECCQQRDWKFCAAWLSLCITHELKVLPALGLGTAVSVGFKYVIGH